MLKQSIKSFSTFQVNYSMKIKVASAEMVKLLAVESGAIIT
jgi:hypothetical protein